MEITFRDLVPLLANRIFPLGAKGRLFSAYVSTIMFYGSALCSAKEEDVNWSLNFCRESYNLIKPEEHDRILTE